jgi:hypothetical protein
MRSDDIKPIVVATAVALAPVAAPNSQATGMLSSERNGDGTIVKPGASERSGFPMRRSRAARLRQVETIQVHHLDPGRNEVLREFLLVVVTGVDLGQRPQLGI